jgi:sigma-B regulation protein RsbU (phosphoserine phosphatase)
VSRARDAWLFGLLGWDPTWERRVPPRVKALWAVAISVITGTPGLLAILAAFLLPPERRWLPFAILVPFMLAIPVLQVTFRRELLRRLDTDADERAAREIQSRLIPAALPATPGLELAHHYAPFRIVGGDYYDAIPIDASRLLVVMADVSGKGTGAALLTASLQAILHYTAYRLVPGGDVEQSRALAPETLAAAIDAHLLRHTEPNRFATMVLAVFDLAERRLRYVNAGHAPPLGVTADGRALRLDSTGPPLGLLEGAGWACREEALPAGTTILFHTDGLSEQPGRGGALYGEERILGALRGSAGQPADGVLAAVLRDAERFASGTPAEDDTALLVVRAV